MRAMEEKRCTYASEKQETLFLPGKKTTNINETSENKKKMNYFLIKTSNISWKVKERELKRVGGWN